MPKCATLDLGPSKNYKTKVICDRWEQQRAAWLSINNKKIDPRDGLAQATIPQDHNQKLKEDKHISVRKSIKRTMRSV